MPFTREQFIAVFASYNQAIVPAQVVAYALGIAAIWFCFRPPSWGSKFVAAVLGLFWLWNGIFYQWMFFSEINPIARVFGVFMVVQGLLFLYAGLLRPSLHFGVAGGGVFSWVGGLMILYAMVIYPLLGYVAGHWWPGMPVFGVAPCPTTIFTFGILLWTTDRVPKYLLVIPLLWALVGTFAALSLGIPEDYALPVAALISLALLIWRDRSHAAPHAGAHPTPA